MALIAFLVYPIVLHLADLKVHCSHWGLTRTPRTQTWLGDPHGFEFGESHANGKLEPEPDRLIVNHPWNGCTKKIQ